jgi:hypothetical protein
MMKGNIHVFWNFIFQSYLYSEADINEGISRSSQVSPIQRGSPDSEDTTPSIYAVVLKLIFSGQTSRRTPSLTVHTSNMLVFHSMPLSSVKTLLLFAFVISVSSTEYCLKVRPTMGKLKHYKLKEIIGKK